SGWQVVLGLMAFGDWAAWTAISLSGIFGFYLLIRLGISARLGGDPSLTLAQTAFAAHRGAALRVRRHPADGDVGAVDPHGRAAHAAGGAQGRTAGRARDDPRAGAGGRADPPEQP